MKNPLIIGAGGVASYLLPVLIKTFRVKGLTLVDKDILEERNLDRQMFTSAYIGKNKAHALMSLHAPNDSFGRVIEEWFERTMEIPEETDCIICIADNHLARADALFVADRQMIPCFLGGNEYLDNEAYVYLPAWKDTKRDPRKSKPEIIQAGDEGSPTACTGKAQEASPQLAIANMGCAYKILHLMWVWLVVRGTLGKEAIEHLPYELYSGLTDHHGLV